MFRVYLLYSPSSGRTYSGYTNDLDRRLVEHNLTESKGFTLRYRPWVLIHQEEYATKAEAMQREKFFKSGQGREVVKQLVKIYLKEKGVRYPPEFKK